MKSLALYSEIILVSCQLHEHSPDIIVHEECLLIKSPGKGHGQDGVKPFPLA